MPTISTRPARFAETKGHLFEGGIRQPLIARWTGNVAANRTDTQHRDLDARSVSNADSNRRSRQSSRRDIRWREFERRTARQSIASTIEAAFLEHESRTIPRPIRIPILREPVRMGRKFSRFATATGSCSSMPKGPRLSCTIFRTIWPKRRIAHQQNTAVVNLLSQQALSIRYSTPSRTLPDAVTPHCSIKSAGSSEPRQRGRGRQLVRYGDQ